MSDTLAFKVFCIEEYKNARNISGQDAATLFIEYSVLEYLTKHYDALHSQGPDYLIDDISQFIYNRQTEKE